MVPRFFWLLLVNNATDAVQKSIGVTFHWSFDSQIHSALGHCPPSAHQLVHWQFCVSAMKSVCLPSSGCTPPHHHITTTNSVYSLGTIPDSRFWVADVLHPFMRRSLKPFPTRETEGPCKQPRFARRTSRSIA
jgi:hypothetical protein